MICKEEIEAKIYTLEQELIRYEKLFLKQSEEIQELIGKLIRDSYNVYLEDKILLVEQEVGYIEEYGEERKTRKLSQQFSILELDSIILPSFKVVTDRMFQLRKEFLGSIQRDIVI